jgi:hypothetical protein
MVESQLNTKESLKLIKFIPFHLTYPLGVEPLSSALNSLEIPSALSVR